MINGVENALRKIFQTIPKPILTAAFTPEQYSVSLDKRIHDEIIIGRVIGDCNIEAGKLKKIRLKQEWVERTSDPELSPMGESGIYRIPIEAREGRPIVAVLDITFPETIMSANVGYPAAFDNYSGNTLGTLMDTMLESHTLSRGVVMPTPILKGSDMVKLDPPGTYIDAWSLNCRLGYDVNFTGLSMSAIGMLQEMIINATKSYIWTKLIVDIDRAYLSSGQEIGVFKSIVEEYKDASERYDDAKKRFKGASALDPELYRYMVLKGI